MIQTISIADTDQWWEVAFADKRSTFYQTPAWIEVAKCMSPAYKSMSLIGKLADGARFVFPLCSYSRVWPIKRLFSAYDQCYSDLISERPVSDEEYRSIINHLPLSPFASFDLTEVPGTVTDSPFKDIPNFSTNRYISSELTLTGKTFDDIYRGFTKSRREDYRRGVKAGLTFRQSTPDRLTEDFKLFYEIYLETAENRWGDQVVGDLLNEVFLKKFEAVMRRYPENFFLWFAELDGKAVSTATAFGWHGRLDGWVMASRPAHFKIKPAVFILSNILKFSAEQGYDLFHFGPSGTEKGLIDFKRRFGATQVPYQTWHRPSPIINLINRFR